MNEIKYATFEPNIIRTRDFLPILNQDEHGDVPERGEQCLQKTRTIVANQTSAICLLDGEPYHGHTYHLPIEYDDILDQFKVLFCFCSLSCVKRYAMSTRLFRPDIVMPLISMMAYKAYGVTSVIASPSPELLSKYIDPPHCPPSSRRGFTIDEFRSSGNEHNTLISLHQRPFEMSKLHIMTLDASNIISTTSKEATVKKIPNKLFQPSPYTRKRLEEKERAKQIPRMSLDGNGEDTNDTFVDLPSTSFGPSPKCIEHPRVTQTLFDVLQKKTSSCNE